MRVISVLWREEIKICSRWESRPTSDKVKESILYIGPYFWCGKCLDCLAGSGGFIYWKPFSRGMEHAVLIDQRYFSAIKIIKENIEMTKEKTKIWRFIEVNAIEGLNVRQLNITLFRYASF